MSQTEEELGFAEERLGFLAEDADEMSGLACIDAIDLIDKLIAKARLTRELLATRAVKVLEQPLMVNGSVWYVSDDYVDRDDHDKIAALVAARYSSDENGEIRTDTTEVARDVAAAMRLLYLSPSSTMKSTVAKQLGLAGARSRENRGKKLVKKPVEEPQS